MDATSKKSLGVSQDSTLSARRRDESSHHEAHQLWSATLRDVEDGEAAANTFGECLRIIRRRLSYKQSVLADMIGCTEAALSFWETGARSPSPKNLVRILGTLVGCRVSTAELLALRGAWRLDVTGRPRAMRIALPPIR
jgi:DNA-binding transcriptional regulator YiaG